MQDNESSDSNNNNNNKNKQEKVIRIELNDGRFLELHSEVGRFSINTVPDDENLEITNLGTDWIEIINSVPLYSKFEPHSSNVNDPKNQNINNNNKNKKQPKKSSHAVIGKDVAISYIFNEIGRM